MSLPVAILAGGLATRLRPTTETIPKSLVDVAGQPFVAHQVDLLAQHDLKDIVLLVGHMGEMMGDVLGDGSRWGVRLRYVFDGPRRLGTGGAIRNALRELGEAFFVLYGDSYLECDYAAVERAFRASGKRGLMTVCRNDDRWDRSNVLLEHGRIVRYDKKHRTPDMRHIDYGLGVFRADAFVAQGDGGLGDAGAEAPDCKESTESAFDLATVYQDLVARDDLAGFEVRGRFYEIGSPEGLAETRAYLEWKTKGVQ
jgi:NDP-sugar pyrophosphorylase family protein